MEEIKSPEPRESREEKRKKYREELAKYDRLLGFAIDLSDTVGGRKTTQVIIHAIQLYTRLSVTAFSLARLMPHSRFIKPGMNFWDWPSVASLTRNMMETYNIFYYLGVEAVSKEESDFRMSILYYHLNSEKYRLYKEMGAPESTLKEFEENLPKKKEEIRSHTHFQVIKEDRRTDVLKGNRAMYLSHFEISEKHPFIKQHFRGFYRLLSNQVHTTPFSFTSQSNERGRGEENGAELDYLTLSLQIAQQYLSAAIMDVCDIFPEFTKDKHRKAKEFAFGILSE